MVDEKPKFAHRWVLGATILASSLSFIDGSVVNVGLPAISKDLHGSAADLQWVINGYTLLLTALLLLGGALGDRYGRRRLLVIGTIVFAISSGACAIAPSLPVLIAARCLQGVGSALLMPNSLAILGDTYSGEAKGRAIGIWAAVGAMTAAVGPVLGGALIDTIGWRAIFLINVPVAAAAIWLAFRFVENQKADGKRTALDFTGAALATISLGALTWGLTIGSGPDGWSPMAIGGVAVGAVLLCAFLLAEHAKKDQAMMPLALFGSKSFVGLSLLTLLLYGALGGVLVLLPYLLIEAAGYSATIAGAALLPFPLILTIASPWMGGLAGKIGSKLPLTIGSLIVALGFLLALRISGEGHYWTEVLPPMLVISLGMAGAVAPLTTAVLTSVDSRHTGSASGLNSALARAGGLIATALLGAVLAAKGQALVQGFHSALVVGAIAAVGAGAGAFVLIADKKKDRRPARAVPSNAQP
jgi:EmrB/QacA subfamily drug resistance transporter